MRMKIGGLSLAIAVAIVTASFAFAMPHVLLSAKTVKSPDRASSGSPKAPGSDDSQDEARDDQEPSPAHQGHGQVVSLAAHCPIIGPGHGVLVRSVASDPHASMSDARSACASALRTAPRIIGESKLHGRSAQAHRKNSSMTPRSKAHSTTR
jgi:hypothetical protein